MKRLPHGAVAVQKDLFGDTIGFYLSCPRCQRTHTRKAKTLRGNPALVVVNLKCPHCGKAAGYATQAPTERPGDAAP